MHAQMVAYLLDNIPLNVVYFMLSEIWYFKNKGGPMLKFPSVITDLSKIFEVEECLGDTLISPKTPIYPLKIQKKSALGKTKKRKVDLEKLMKDYMHSCRPSSAGLFEDLSGLG
ncbi:hypothetical protein FXO37_18235 [Capsicum annuum]|nr:hypothetical protein FXO37_18235 [Capsicum annuum]